MIARAHRVLGILVRAKSHDLTLHFHVYPVGITPEAAG